MAKINGSFYFKRTDSGNLVGEYLNNEITESRPESALRLPHNLDKGFPGDYVSTWFEPTDEEGQGESVAARLRIDHHREVPALYDLRWTSMRSGRTHYEGRATLCDGMLVGHYWSVR